MRPRSTCPRGSRSWFSGAFSETAGARSSTTTSARAEAAYAGAAAKASNAPSATNRARAGSLTSSGYPEPVIFDTGIQLRLCCSR